MSLNLSAFDNNDENFSYYLNALALVSKHTKQQQHEISPVTLYSEWNKMGRLLLLSVLSVIGTVGNIFLISSVMIEDHLKKAGNAFIVNLALADLLVTSILMPASIIVLLAGIDESLLLICKFQWFLTACAFLVSILTLVMTALENYIRLCLPQEDQQWFNKTNTTAILLIIWCIGSALSGAQFVFTTSFDYCTRQMTKLLPAECAIMFFCIAMPIMVTFCTHIKMIRDVKKFMAFPSFKANITYTWDLALARTNFYSFLTFIIFWVPFGIVAGMPNYFSNRVFYNSAWIGLSKSCFHNMIYCMTNRHFRSAYNNLFHYCCCKTNVTTQRRQRSNEGNNRPASDPTHVRVHIIPGYNMYSYTSPDRRAGNSKRECHEL